MTENAERVVRFLCTEQGRHPRKVLETVAPWGDGVRRVRHGQAIDSSPFGHPLDRVAGDGILDHYRAQGGQSQLPPFDLRCPDCGWNGRAGELKMRQIVNALLQLHPADVVVAYDVSHPSSSILF